MIGVGASSAEGRMVSPRSVSPFRAYRLRARRRSGSSGCASSFRRAVSAVAQLAGGMEAHPELPERLRDLSLYARKGFTERGVKIRESALEAPTPIIPLYTYETYWTLEAAAEIYDRGVYVNPTLPPATPEGEALLRTSYMATHTVALLDEAMDIISDVMVKRHE